MVSGRAKPPKADRSSLPAAGQKAVSVCRPSFRQPPDSAMERLKKRRDFLRTAKGSKRVMPGLVLQARRQHTAGDCDPGARIGYTASRRVGGAVQRNRARRRLREAVRATLPSRAKPGYDYVVVARQGTLTRSWTDLIRDLETAADTIHHTQPHRNKKRAANHFSKRGLD